MEELKITPKPEASAQEAFDNIRHAHTLGLPIVSELLPAHDGVVSICGNAPSLAKTMKHIKGDVWALNGAHDYLLNQGIFPHVGFYWDAVHEAVRHAQNPMEGVKYYIASHCHPDMFEALKGHDVTLFHAEMGHEAQPLIESLEWFAPIFHGGSTATMRAPFLAYGLGYREIHIHGTDGSYGEVSHIDRDDYDDYGVESIEVTCYDKTFKTAPWMAVQAKELPKIAHLMKDAKIIVHGDGLVPHVARVFGLHAGQYERY